MLNNPFTNVDLPFGANNLLVIEEEMQSARK